MSLKIELMPSAVLGAALLTAPVFAGTMKTHHDYHPGADTARAYSHRHIVTGGRIYLPDNRGDANWNARVNYNDQFILDP